MVMPLGDLERTRITPYATYVLIALNVIVYLVQLELGDDFTIAYAATPYEISHGTDIHHEVEVPRVLFGKDAPVVIRHAPVPIPVWLTLITAMFLHGSPLHLAGNMLYLWIFGDNVEEVLGRIRYILIYLTCGIIGMAAQVIAEPTSKVPVLGASGAIAGGDGDVCRVVSPQPGTRAGRSLHHRASRARGDRRLDRDSGLGGNRRGEARRRR